MDVISSRTDGEKTKQIIHAIIHNIMLTVQDKQTCTNFKETEIKKIYNT